MNSPPTPGKENVPPANPGSEDVPSSNRRPGAEASTGNATKPLILLIDLGNTRIKWAWLSGAGTETEGAGAARTGDGLADLPFLETAEVITGALACNVAGIELGRKLAGLVRDRLAVELAFVQARASACGVTAAYANPLNLGADRWAALIGAHSLGPADCCIVDAGSTVTMDLLLADGRHLGGYIAPGREMSLAAMAKGTAELASRLKDHSGRPQDLAPGTDSAEAMEKGTLAAQLGMIRSGMERLASQGGGSPALLLTGGGADDLIATGQLPEAQVVPDLVLRGLAALALELRLRPE